jgi:hypothetical protein
VEWLREGEGNRNRCKVTSVFFSRVIDGIAMCGKMNTRTEKGDYI